MNSDYHMEIYKGEDFYEKQASLIECHTCLENAIDCLKPFDEFKDEVDYIKIALIEVKKKEEEY